MSKHRSDQEWFSIIQECRTSGLTDRAWLSYHPEINRTTFYRHIRQLRKQACEVPSKTDASIPVFNEVVGIDLDVLPEVRQKVFPQPAAISATLKPEQTERAADRVVIQLEYHGIHMGITNAASSSAIAHTIAALQKLC